MTSLSEISPPIFYYAKIDEVKNKWLTFAETLPEEERVECEKKVKQIAFTIIGKIRELYFLDGTDHLEKKTDQWKESFERTAIQVCQSKEIYSKDRKAMQKEFASLDVELKKPLSSTLPKISLKSSENFLRSALDIAEEKQSTSLPEIPEEPRQIFQAATLHHFEHKFGKPRAAGLEFGMEATGEYFKLADSTSRIRDAATSAGAHLTLVEAASFVVQDRLPVGMAIAIIHAVGSSARSIDPLMKKIFDDPNLKGGSELCVPRMYDCPSVEEMRMNAWLLSQALQLPSDFLHAAHHSMTENATRTFETLGITDESILRFFEALAEAESQPVPF